MSLILRSTCRSDVGLVRSNNEDSAFAGSRVIAVADGVGGSPAGEEASDIVIRALTELEESLTRGTGPDPDDPVGALLATVEKANDEVREAAGARADWSGMGTTVTALLLHGTKLGLLHIGDSRCYLFRGDKLHQVTKDHTFVQSLVDHGVLTPEAARRHPQRSLVIHALQGQRLEPACAVLSPRVGDRFLLCSDGLSDVIPDADIAGVLRGHDDPAGCTERLVQLALAAGAPDNVTVIVADVADGDAPTVILPAAAEVKPVHSVNEATVLLPTL